MTLFYDYFRKVNREVFILSILAVLFIGYFLIAYNVYGSFLIIMALVTIITILRRKKLDMKSYFGGTLGHILHYFKRP